MTALHAPIGRYAEAPPDEPDCDGLIDAILATRANELHADGESTELLVMLHEAAPQLRQLLATVPKSSLGCYGNVSRLLDEAESLAKHVGRKLNEWRRAA